MRSIRSLLGCLLLLGFLVGCSLLDENSNSEDNNGEDTNSAPTIQAPQVVSFEGDVATNADEESFVTLVWEVTGTDPELSISPEPGTVTGTSVTLPLSETATYTLTATNSAGTNSKSVTVNTDTQPEPPGGDPEPPSEPPEEEPLDLTGTWRLTAPIEIHNDCPLDWLFELIQDESGMVLTGSYDYGRDDPNASDPLLTCSGNSDGIFNPALEGSISVDGTITLRGDYIYGADYTGAPPEDEDRIVLEATPTDTDTLAANLEVISPGGSSTPFTTAATMARVEDDELASPAN